jgi:hypothetical protein
MALTTFVALYRGKTIATAQLVAVSADAKLAAYVASQLLGEDDMSDDPVLEKVRRGRRAALRVVKQEGQAKEREAGALGGLVDADIAEGPE